MTVVKTIAAAAVLAIVAIGPASAGCSYSHQETVAEAAKPAEVAAAPAVEAPAPAADKAVVAAPASPSTEVATAAQAAPSAVKTN